MIEEGPPSELGDGRRLRSPLRRFPFTLVALGLLVAVGSATETYQSDLARRFLRRFGWAPVDLAFEELYRLITSAFVTFGGSVFWIAILMVAGMVGLAEWREGTRRTALTFWGGHAGTLLLLTGAAYAMAWSNPDSADRWIGIRDLGPSAGALACLGLVVARAPIPGKAWASAGVLGVVAVDALFFAGIPAETSADIAHLIAFPLGYATAYIRSAP